jgi:hypothetical protein
MVSSSVEKTLILLFYGYMEPAVEKRFQRIEAIQRETAELNRRAELRMDKFDKKLEATRRLVEAGIKFVSRLSIEVRQTGREIRELRREVSEVSRIQKAMLRSHTNGKNGHS